MLPHMVDRVRKVLPTVVERPCPVCDGELQLVRSREVRHGIARLNPFWDGKPSTYVLCPGCGARLPA
jgi:predicted RNA-binding Zn-ribbon protein involved in translation (DUF1610 family)